MNKTVFLIKSAPINTCIKQKLQHKKLKYLFFQ